MELGTLLSLIISAASATAAIAAVFVALYVSYQASAPEVVVHIERDDDSCSYYIVVSNYGKGVARNFRFEYFDFSIVASKFREEARKSFLTAGIPLLTPNSNRYTAIAAGNDVREVKNASCIAKVSYEKQRWFCKWRPKVIRDEFQLDYVAYKGALYTESELHKIRHEMVIISKNLGEINRKLSSNERVSLKDSD